MIVGIGHVARVGKDTAATALCRDLGFVRYGFADQLKALAMEADPLVTAQTQRVNVGIGHGRLKWVVQGLGGWEAAKDTYPEARAFLQNLGLGARKVFGEDFWVEQLFRKIAAEGHENVVVPDVRFPNEAAAIRAAGGFLIRIDRPGHQPGGHVSETAGVGIEFDHVVPNAGSLLELEQRVVDLVRTIISDQLRAVEVGG